MAQKYLLVCVCDADEMGRTIKLQQDVHKSCSIPFNLSDCQQHFNAYRSENTASSSCCFDVHAAQTLLLYLM